MKQTAVEWLISQLNIWQSITDEDTNQTLDTVRKLLEQAKEMEKQQIIDAHGNKQKMNAGISTYKYTLTGEQYYNETYVK